MQKVVLALLTLIVLLSVAYVLYSNIELPAPVLSSPSDSSTVTPQSPTPARSSDSTVGTTTGHAEAASTTDSEPKTPVNARPGDEEGLGLSVLGKLMIPAGHEREYFYALRPELDVTAVYYESNRLGEEPVFKIERLYPEVYTKDDIKSDLTGVAPIELFWPGTTIDPDAYTQVESLVEADPSFIFTEEGCSRYMGGNDCAIGVYVNEHDLQPGRLEQDTGPYEWGKSMTLADITVLPEGRLLLQWGFGDAGARVVEYSIWDTIANTNIETVSWGGMVGEAMSITVNLQGTEKHLGILNPELFGADRPVGVTDVYAEALFESLPDVLFKEPPQYCVTVTPTPKDPTDPTAPWLLEYSYGCEEVGYDIARRYYELDPVTESLTPLGGILYP